MYIAPQLPNIVLLINRFSNITLYIRYLIRKLLVVRTLSIIYAAVMIEILLIL